MTLPLSSWFPLLPEENGGGLFAAVRIDVLAVLKPVGG